MENHELPGKLYTIGYSGFNIKKFIDTLNDFCINVIIDVRSSPYSARFTDYNYENLCLIVKKRNFWKNREVYYLNLKENFGARQLNKKYYNEHEKYLDFEKFRQSSLFLNGCERVHKGLSLGYNIVLLCSEIEPRNCHRAVMITRWFDINGYKIKHILPEKIKEQKDIDEELLENYLKKDYIKNTMSGNLLLPDKTPEQIRLDNIEKAYRKRNREIGFRANENEEYTC